MRQSIRGLKGALAAYDAGTIVDYSELADATRAYLALRQGSLADDPAALQRAKAEIGRYLLEPDDNREDTIEALAVRVLRAAETGDTE